MIYHSAVFQASQAHLKRFALELVHQLIPQGKILSSQLNDESAHLLIQSDSVLAGFEFHTKELGVGAFQGALKTLADLELARKKGTAPAAKEIRLYVLAHHFSQDFLNQIPSSWQGMRLLEWTFIRSESGEGMLIREVKMPIPQKKTADQNYKTGRIEKLSLAHDKEEWSTSELIAFARLGIELRNHSLRQRLTA